MSDSTLGKDSLREDTAGSSFDVPLSAARSRGQLLLSLEALEAQNQKFLAIVQHLEELFVALLAEREDESQSEDEDESAPPAKRVFATAFRRC